MRSTHYRSSNQRADRVEADLVLTGGRIYTGAAERPFVEAVGIRDGRFVAVGSAAQVRLYN